MAVTTSSQLFVKPLGYIEETTEGTTPTSSPTFLTTGAVQSVSIKKGNNLVPIGQIGAEDVIDYIAGPTLREFSVNFNLTSSTFLKYGVNAANYASPAGTISKSLSFVHSVYLNGVENYIYFKGARPKSCSITMEVGKATECSMDFVCTAITAPATSHGLGTPTFPSFVSATDVWDWLDGGASPIQFNGVALDCTKFTCNVERNTSMDYVLGSTTGFGSQPHARRISGEFTVLWHANTQEAALDAFTESSASNTTATLKSATSTLTLPYAEISELSRDHSVDESGATVCTYSYMSEAATLT